MIINKYELYKQYKQIKTTCLINGIPVIDILPIPSEYDFTDKEMEQIRKKIDPEEYKQLKKEYVKQRKIEIQILNGKHKTYKNMLDYKEAQIMNFIKQFPQFQSIIQRD